MIQERSQNVFVDTTFASPKAIQNIERSINRKRQVGIVYLYQDPIIAWQITKKREKIEGRKVPKNIFIEACFSAGVNVIQVKKKFGNKINIRIRSLKMSSNKTSKDQI